LDYILSIDLQSRFELQCRLELVTPKFIELCQCLPDVHLEFGIQTLNPQEYNIIHRKNNLSKIYHMMKLLNDAQISYETHLISGLPTQTLDSLLASYNQLKQWEVPQICVFPLQILRGTPLALQQTKYGIITSPFFPHEVIQSNSFSLEDWLFAKTLN